MAITLGALTFDERHTDLSETLEEVGGRNERRITVKGLIVGEESVSDIHDQIDVILDAASTEDFSAALIIRSGRQLNVRRRGFQRDVRADVLTGSYTLELEAREPYEEAIAGVLENWTVTTSGDTQVSTPGGNRNTPTKITLVATGSIVNPTVSDGVDTISYSGFVSDGESLVFDGRDEVVTLEGSDVIAYTSGVFPNLEPGGTTLTYTDDVTSSHTAGLTVEYKARWW
jgi:hypothetical protein